MKVRITSNHLTVTLNLLSHATLLNKGGGYQPIYLGSFNFELAVKTHAAHINDHNLPITSPNIFK